jgi:exonuclease III
MKIASWNVNSIKVRIPHLMEWVAQADPDVVLLQELKATEEWSGKKPTMAWPFSPRGLLK